MHEFEASLSYSETLSQNNKKHTLARQQKAVHTLFKANLFSL